MKINNKILNVDIIIMFLFSIFSILLFVENRMFYLNKYKIFEIFNNELFYYIGNIIGILLIIYSLIKSIIGIVILILQIIDKNEILHGKIYLLFLLPIAITLLSYIIYFCYIIINFYNYFDILTVLILVYLIILIGLFMWLIYLTFYNIKLKPIKLLIINILTPLNLILYIEILKYMGP